MGFEDYSVIICPNLGSPLYSGNNRTTLVEFSRMIQEKWPEFHSDEFELTHLERPKRPEEVFLVYKTPLGLFQMLVYLSPREQNNILFMLRFAYCNPRSVYEPFCTVIEWLMRHYDMYCQVMRDFAPEQGSLLKNVDNAAEIRSLLIPSMDYNRRLWQLDAQSDEEATLRPSEAIARFIFPQFATLP